MSSIETKALTIIAQGQRIAEAGKLIRAEVLRKKYEDEFGGAFLADSSEDRIQQADSAIRDAIRLITQQA
jgi:hypothetical protein